MTRKVTIALDAMGGDRGPDVIVSAALATLEKDDTVCLVLVGLADLLESAKRKAGERYGNRLGYQAATEVVSMDEPPDHALRRKKDSSMRVAIELVKSGAADACCATARAAPKSARSNCSCAVLYTCDRVPTLAINASRPSVTSGVSRRRGTSAVVGDIGCHSTAAR